MKSTLFSFASWFLSDPRRAFVILSVIVLVILMAVAMAPDGSAVAGDITSGS